MAFNPYSSGPAVSPYLSGMADDIGRRSNLQLQQGLQGIRSNSVMDGGFGGSRQGVAEGAAMSNAADTLQGNLSNMYNTDYQAGQNRDLQRYGIDKQAQSAKYGADSALQGSMYGADNSLKGSMHSADTSLQGSMYGSDSALKSSMYGADSSLKGSIYGANTSYNIAGMNNATTQRGQDQSYNLGMGQNQIGLQNANTNATQVGNQYTLGQGQNANQATANQNSYSLGMGNLGLSAQNSAQQYDLGLRGSDYNYANLDANTYQNSVNNQFRGAELGMNVQNQMQQQDQLGLKTGTDMQNMPLNYYNQFADRASQIAQGGGTATGSMSAQGSPIVGALGGAQLGSAFAKNLGLRDPAVTDDGYGQGTGSAYGGSTDNGMFTPYRAGR